MLLPVHEQAFLFAKVQDRLPSGVGVALAPFDAFLQVQGKVAFARLTERLCLPQPPTRIVHSRAELEATSHFPYYLKDVYRLVQFARTFLDTFPRESDLPPRLHC